MNGKEDKGAVYRMYSYNFVEWILFFYIYCFLGWIWESCYVSVKQKKWINRGFMHGPMLPIYGSGAIIVLLSTIPVRDNLFLVFICGMIGATLLEYVTGVVMEAIFHVRYWDYSNQPFNLNGHICLLSSLAWGGFSILMIRILHQPIEYIVLYINRTWAEVIVLVTSACMIVDMTQSFNEAMDLKEMLAQITESNAEIQLIRKKLDMVVAVVDSDTAKLKELLLESKQKIEDKLIEEKQYYGAQVKAFQDKHIPNRNVKEGSLEIFRRGKDYALQGLSHKVSTYLEQIEKYTSSIEIRPAKEVGKLKAELEELVGKIARQKENMLQLRHKTYDRSMSMLRRNPGAISKKYEEALKEIKDLVKSANR